MKRRIILAFSLLMVFGLTVVAFAYTTSTAADHTSVSCCSGDSCPLKGKNAASGETASCCDDANCPHKGGDSCPMKMHGPAKHKMDTGGVEMKKVNMPAEHKESCDGSCCAAKQNAKAQS